MDDLLIRLLWYVLTLLDKHLLHTTAYQWNFANESFQFLCPWKYSVDHTHWDQSSGQALVGHLD